MQILGRLLLVVFLLIAGFLTYENLVSDDFEYCKRTFKTDKKNYKVGDSIYLTLKIVPEKKSKTIKVYNDYSNLVFSIDIRLKEGTPDSLEYDMGGEQKRLNRRVKVIIKRY